MVCHRNRAHTDHRFQPLRQEGLDLALTSEVHPTHLVGVVHDDKKSAHRP